MRSHHNRQMRRQSVALLVGLVPLLGCGGCGDPVAPPLEPTRDCSVYGSQASSPYALPYAPGTSYTVGLTTGHPGWHRYAIDFLMPIGTSLIAARSGRAQEIKEDAFDWDHDLEDGNYLLILHADGTLAMYGHLTHDGALVEVGQLVAVGQVIARSGHSGQSTEPHLHFEVMRCPLGAPPCESIPTLFRNTVPTPCGLQVGVSYPAWAF